MEFIWNYIACYCKINIESDKRLRSTQNCNVGIYVVNKTERNKKAFNTWK